MHIIRYVISVRCRCRYVYEQHYVRSIINFAMPKNKSGTLTVVTVTNNFKGTVERFFTSDTAFLFMNGASFYML